MAEQEMTAGNEEELDPSSVGGLNQLRDDAARSAEAEAAEELEKYLTFELEAEEYGVEILKVREIFGYTDVTPVPQTPDFVKGVINLRGQVIPVIDLRIKFGMAEGEITNETCIIVVEVALEEAAGGVVEMGIIVDRVQEVLDIPESNIDPAPSFGADIKTEYIQGMGKVDDQVKILLDIDEVLSEEELVSLDQIREESD